jgi:two-component system chemotaxis response regulator CheY
LARKILLADDSVTAQNMGRKILADAGYEVITVNNGSAALKKIAEQKPDLIVLDVYMPGYSGLEVCQRLKEVGETSRIPVLLTVGKLEPFKPEEAKRVRADGFIVKPFEASELLSALSKLEDKVVPRADSSKPGRFARATAAIEEGRYDKTMAIEEDDTGWKRRIAFPSKKKQEKLAQENVDDPAIYNAVNKDLRTVITHTAVEPTPVQVMRVPASSAEEANVNVGALAPEGLPKDVTPEEIAALAAAAAQIKGKVVEERPPAPAEMPVTVPTESEAPKVEVAEVAKPESKEPQKEKVEVRPPESAPMPEVAAAAPPATFAEQQPVDKIEIEIKSTRPEIVSIQADAMTAMMGLETQMMAVHFPIPGNGTGTNGAAIPTQEPVTMAVAAAADASPSRWTAVAVAVAPDEAAVSLEQEMQKAYAAFAAAEGGHAVITSATPAAKPAVTEAIEAPVVTVEPPVAEAAASIPAIPAPEVAQPLAAVSVAATEAISAAVKELEAVAAKYEAERSATSPEPITDKSLQAAALESPAAAPDAEANPEQKIEDKTEEKFEPKVEEKIEAKVEEQPKGAELAQQAVGLETTAEAAVPQDQPQSERTQDEPAALVTETPEPAAEAERHEEESKSEEASTEPVPVSSTSRAGGSDEMAKRETETAAAWASWRKIRETGGSKTDNPAEASVKESEDSIPEDRAAMAVAAGAESKPEEVAGSFDSDPEIASIVDSVLADMRPKIVEEIARKLGKKK